MRAFVVDESRSLLVEDRPKWGRRRIGETGIHLPYSTFSSERLTAPVVVAEDAEKTVVFLYSKEKLGMWRVERRLG